jgi:flagellar biosynthesis/type III secretory pathway protein FliH
MSSLIKSGLVGAQGSVLLKAKNVQEEVEAAGPAQATGGPSADQADVLERLQEEAKRKGYAEGLEQAQAALAKKTSELEKSFQKLEADCRERTKAAEATLTKATEEVMSHMTELQQAFESQLVVLTLECLYKLAGRKEFYKEIVDERIKRRLIATPFDTSVYVRLPKDLSADFESLAIALEGTCRVVFDPDLKPGDCIIESGLITENVNIVVLVDQVREGLLQVLESRASNAEH